MAELNRPNASATNLSIISVYTTALEVCYSVYGEPPVSFDAIQRFYEADATRVLQSAVYENPFLTATSRSVIADIFQLSRQFSTVNIPRPLAVIYTLFRLRPPERTTNPLFRALRVWTDIGDISESESFDGHKKVIVEHYLNMLLLPGLHVDCATHLRFQPCKQIDPHHPAFPSLPIPGTSLSLPSPFHFRLHVISRLSFNELGKITHHRDFWDIKDVMGLVPGVSLAQWISTRLTARALRCVTRFWGEDAAEHSSSPAPMAPSSLSPDVEKGITAAQAYMTSTKDSLGLEGV